MTEEEIKKWKEKIDKMTQVEMARLRRFAPSGHPCFTTTTDLPTYFQDRFKELGGMTPAISKEIGL